jgi:GT2 family glycosyltransferase
MNYRIAIPVFNQLQYTAGCLDSLRDSGVPDEAIVVVNNGSTDGTREFLGRRAGIEVIHNSENRGCGFAWNQGVKAAAAVWTVLLNNDVLVPRGFMDGLVGFAEAADIDIASPAMREGELDYDFQAYAQVFTRRMAAVRRLGAANGVCFMVHRRVFDMIGVFDEEPKLGGYEDDEFFRRARDARRRLAISGRAFLHHYGSITQKSMKACLREPLISLGDRDYYRRKYRLTWLKRRRERIRERILTTFWRQKELWRYGLTLREKRIGGSWVFL